jgi:hypothetical protein
VSNCFDPEVIPRLEHDVVGFASEQDAKHLSEARFIVYDEDAGKLRGDRRHPEFRLTQPAPAASRFLARVD